MTKEVLSKDFHSREVLIQSILAMVRSGTIKLPQADFASVQQVDNPNGVKECVRTVCQNYSDILNLAMLAEEFMKRTTHKGAGMIDNDLLSDFFEENSEIKPDENEA